MSAEATLIIRNGTVVDGTGADPVEADLAIAGDRILHIGEVAGRRGVEEIDARGKLVTPGFVDIHTHYDGQAVWDSHLAPSAWHGVTTAIMGNCGVGFAPCKPADRDKLVELMEGVEDIPGPVLHEGLNWQWETFEEYLDVLERLPRDMDLGVLLPHAAVRVYVMGERALNLENATAEDIAKMRAIAADAVRAGAFGFSTSRTISHKSLAGDYTPTLRAQEEELTGIAMGMADAGSGFLEMVSDWDEPDPETEFAMLRRVIEASGRTAVFTLNQRHDRPDFWRDLLRLAGEAADDGLSIRPVVAPRPIGILLGLEGSQNPFSGTATYRSIQDLPLAERVAAMRDPEVRAKILSEDPVKNSTFPLIHRISFSKMFRLGSPANYEPAKDQSIAAIAAREGRTAPEVAYDILLEREGRGFIYTPLVNYASYDMSAPEAMLADPNAIMGLGDGGAHVGFILDAGYPTWLMSYWGRERARFPMTDVIRRLTSDTASAAGLSDRGVLAPGMKADVNIIDWDRVGFSDPYVTRDLPANGKRLMQKSTGYEATIVSGKVTYRGGEATEALPGKVVRGQR
ncbi:N-acyl-D-amino-acid deacylase family protein [Nisaea sp.]|uniref:N-acyl-D-amino-acid deacylase family protein n=1 Tax=Nisaea sp. TaxID=2024842 RepID=UPI003B51AC3F